MGIYERDKISPNYAALSGATRLWLERHAPLPAPIEVSPLLDGRWRDVLLRAAEIVERGWCQRVDRDAEGRVCLAEAIRESKNTLGANWESWRTALRRLQGMICVSVLDDVFPAGLVLWNDKEGRTQAEVAAALRECARG